MLSLTEAAGSANSRKPGKDSDCAHHPRLRIHTHPIIHPSIHPSSLQPHRSRSPSPPFDWRRARIPRRPESQKWYQQAFCYVTVSSVCGLEPGLSRRDILASGKYAKPPVHRRPPGDLRVRYEALDLDPKLVWLKHTATYIILALGCHFAHVVAPWAS